MRVLVDLNVLLDVVQRRESHYAASAAILSRVAAGDLEGAIAAHALTTIHYVIERFAGRERAAQAIDFLLKDFEIVPADREVFLRARSLEIADFEDAVVASCAATAGCERIVTRNVADFTASPVPASTPAEMAAELGVVAELGEVDESGADDAKS